MGWLFAKRKDDWNALGLSGGQPKSENAFRGVMDNLFAGADDISEEAIAAGELEGCKLLILPQQLNMSDAAVDAIRKYVREGGFVVACISPATRHRMGKPRGNSALADVFGVDFSEAQIHKESESWYSVGVKSPEDAEPVFSHDLNWLPGQVSFLGIEPKTAVAHAKILSKEGKETKGCFLNKYGKGQALLLNFGYGEVNDKTMAYHLIFGRLLLDWAGIEPEARIVDPVTRQPLPYRPLYRFKRGKAVLLGSLRGHSRWEGPNVVLVDPGRLLSVKDEAMFVWSGNKHAYNVRTGEYLGFGEEAKIDLPSFEGRLLCLLPYKVEHVDLTAPGRAKPGEVVTIKAEIKTDGDPPGEHVIYFEATSPTGARRPLYCGTRVAPDGKASFEIPFALNDHTGEWTVTARDVMTGVEAAAQIIINGLLPQSKIGHSACGAGFSAVADKG
jgi:hypothetical protein